MPAEKEKLGPDDVDPRNESDGDYESMPGSFVDDAHNMPGDQPEDDTPPPKTIADGTVEPDTESPESDSTTND